MIDKPSFSGWSKVVSSTPLRKTRFSTIRYSYYYHTEIASSEVLLFFIRGCSHVSKFRFKHSRAVCVCVFFRWHDDDAKGGTEQNDKNHGCVKRSKATPLSCRYMG